jgi:molecular chaperone GrpE
MKDKRTAPFDGLDEQAAPDEMTEPAASAQGDGSSASPEATPAESLDAEADALTGKLAVELEQQKDKYVRLLAEFDNFRRRTVRDRQDAEHRGMGNLLRGMLEMLDDLSRFAHLDPAKTDSKTIAEGVSMVEKKLLKSLAGHGLEVVDPVGKPFDPALHEAISTAPAPSEEADHLVAQTFQVGYVFNGQLLRPARVVVQQWNG